MSQPFRFRHIDLIVGTFVLGGMVAVLAAIALVGAARGWLRFSDEVLVARSVSIHEGKPSKSEEDARLAAYQDLVESLRPGTPVRAGGEVIGAVASCQIDDEFDVIELRMRISATSRKAIGRHDRAHIRLALAGVLGENAVLIRSHGAALPLAADERIRLEIAVDPMRAITGLMGELRSAVPPLIADIHGLVQDARTAIAEVRAQQLPQQTAQLLTEVRAVLQQVAGDQRLETLLKRLEAIAMNAEAISVGLRRGDGAAGKLLTDPALVEQAQRLMADLQVATGELRAIAPQLPHLARSVDETLSGSQKLMDGLSRHWLLRGALGGEPVALPPRGVAIIATPVAEPQK